MRYQVLQQKAKSLQLLGFALSTAIFLISILFPSQAVADNDTPFDEGSVYVNITGFGGTELDALFRDEKAYLSVTALFDYLKIHNRISSDNESVSGFFLSENSQYTISKPKNEIILGKKAFQLDANDLIQTFSGLYLRSDIFGKVFGLDCIFNFRSLSINLQTKVELPIMREKRQQLMRQNLKKIRQEITADTSIIRRYPAFNFGTYDWSVNSTQQPTGEQDTRLNVRLGTILAGGETNLGLVYDSRRDFNLKEQQYLWRYVDNDRKGLRQVKAGKIPVQSTSTLYAPVIGMQFTNAPTTYRRSFGTYNLSDHTEPGWIVELYINNVLVDYVKADASGFFSFKVPLMYGSTNVQLRYFGPWGEERQKEERINVPYSFLPKKELEYTLSAGMLENGEQSRFSRLDVKYGLSERITIGTGTEYLSSLSQGSPVMPFINASARIGSSLIISGDYTYGVRAKGALNYRMPNDMVIQLDYTRYQKGQKATFQNFLEERKAGISKSFRSRNMSGFSRLSVNQIIYPGTQQTTADLLLSASAKKLSVNLTTYAQQMGGGYLNIYSNLALGMRLPGRITFRPQMQYGYKLNQVQQIRAELERPVLKKGYLNFSYQNNLNYNSHNFNLGLRFDLAFARTSVTARNTDHGITFSQSLSGGGLLDLKTNYSKLNNRSNVGKGGLIVYPFLDLNMNNRRDAGEPKVQGLELQINGGRIEKSLKDTTIRIFDLEAYSHYLLELKPSSFDNISYQLKNKSYKVAIEPNKLKLLEIPIMVAGEASGMVYAGNSEDGQGRMLINFFRNGHRVAQTLSESDGFFTFLGLAPGAYVAAIDSVQLQKLGLTAMPRSFTINKNRDGDIADGLDLRLFPAPPELAVKSKLPSSTPASSNQAVKVTDVQGFSILARGTGVHSQALIAQKILVARSGHPVGITPEGTHSYTVKISGFKTGGEAEKFMAQLPSLGFKNAFVVAPASEIKSNRAKEGQKVSTKTSNKELSRYALIVGQANQESDLHSLKNLIRQTLNTSTYIMKRGEYYSLSVLGFRDEPAALQALQKLTTRGIRGYLQPYQEKEARVVNTP